MNEIDRDWVTVNSIRKMRSSRHSSRTGMTARGSMLETPDGAGRELAWASGRSIDGGSIALTLAARFQAARLRNAA